jgi:hypothetical protein
MSCLQLSDAGIAIFIFSLSFSNPGDGGYYQNALTRAQCCKTNCRVKLLSKMVFLLRKLIFQNSIAVKILF